MLAGSAKRGVGGGRGVRVGGGSMKQQQQSLFAFKGFTKTPHTQIHKTQNIVHKDKEEKGKDKEGVFAEAGRKRDKEEEEEEEDAVIQNDKEDKEDKEEEDEDDLVIVAKKKRRRIVQKGNALRGNTQRAAAAKPRTRARRPAPSAAVLMSDDDEMSNGDDDESEESEYEQDDEDDDDDDDDDDDVVDEEDEEEEEEEEEFTPKRRKPQLSSKRKKTASAATTQRGTGSSRLKTPPSSSATPTTLANRIRTTPTPSTATKRTPYQKAVVAASPLTPATLPASAHDDASQNPEERFVDRYTTPPFSSFMSPTTRRDARGRRPDDADFDCTSLRVPSSFLASLPPAQAQWWKLKAESFDAVMLFKMGKFYEMFEMDAHVGAEHLGLLYMKTDERPHVGFPERSYAAYADRLVQRGFRVDVVEQVETPEQLKERNEERKRKGQKKDNVVMRQKVCVLTKGTLVEAFDECSADAANLLVLCELRPEAGTSQQNYSENETTTGCVTGAVLIDAAAGRIECGAVMDDGPARQELRALVSRSRPVEVVSSPGQLAKETERCLDAALAGRSVLRSTHMAPPPPPPIGSQEVRRHRSYGDEWDTFVAHINKMNDTTDATHASRRCALAVRHALALAESYLQRCLVDVQILSRPTLSPLPGAWGRAVAHLLRDDDDGSVGTAGPQHTQTSATTVSAAVGAMSTMHGDDETATAVAVDEMEMDAAAIMGIELLEPAGGDGGVGGSLLSLIDRTVTAPGRRLLRRWLCSPPCASGAILQRQRAIAALRRGGRGTRLSAALRRLPDLERLLARLQSALVGGGRNASNVVLYEDEGRRRVTLLVSALRGIDALASSLLDDVNHAARDDDDDASGRAAAAPSPRPSSSSPQLLLDRILDPHFWRRAQDAASALDFDWAAAESAGRITPRAGADDAHDEAVAAVSSAEQALHAYLEDVREIVRNRSVHYASVGKDSHLLSVPDVALKRVPGSFIVSSRVKGMTRYMTPELEPLVASLVEARENVEHALQAAFRRNVQLFVDSLTLWRECARRAARLDALCSLAAASDALHCAGEGAACTPRILGSSSSSAPRLAARGLVHPCVALALASNGLSFVPNDVSLGGSDTSDERSMLLTGPNMGGKSTALRMVAVAVVMAQLGMDVAASDMELTPFESLFVRMGASDDIAGGRSTFLVELAETASALRGVSHRRSLAILDELGRGTSTSDGLAIAHAVLRHLASIPGCISLFSTHYHGLATSGSDQHRHVQLRHMELREGANGEIAFLYKLRPGQSEKSYGMNVARLAGVPLSVVNAATSQAALMEQRNNSAAPGGDAKDPLALMSRLLDASCRGDSSSLLSIHGSLLSSPSPL